MPASNLCKNLLRRLGIVTVRSHNAAVKYIDAPPNGIFDVVLLRVFAKLGYLRFIQIGANDGIRGDPIRQKVLKYGWTGVLVEPLPPLFAELKRNYANQPGLEFINAAVDVSPGVRTIHFLRPGLAFPDWAQGLATFDLSRLQKTTRELGGKDGTSCTRTLRR